MSKKEQMWPVSCRQKKILWWDHSTHFEITEYRPVSECTCESERVNEERPTSLTQYYNENRNLGLTLWVSHDLFHHCLIIGYLFRLMFYNITNYITHEFLIVYLVWIEKEYFLWCWIHTAKFISEKDLQGMGIYISP